MHNPNYKQIYSDIINKKFPDKKTELEYLLLKETLNNIDVIEINNKIFGTRKETYRQNKRLHSYNRSDIFRILNYQKEQKLNNIQLANHFGISRNTVTKWRRLFIV